MKIGGGRKLVWETSRVTKALEKAEVQGGHDLTLTNPMMGLWLM